MNYSAHFASVQFEVFGQMYPQYASSSTGSTVQKIMDELKIENGGIKKLRCMDCNKPLMNIWITVPKADFVFKNKASCPFCDGESREETVNGLFHYGPIGRDESNDPTLVDNIDTNNDVAGVLSSYFTIKKA